MNGCMRLPGWGWLLLGGLALLGLGLLPGGGDLLRFIVAMVLLAVIPGAVVVGGLLHDPLGLGERLGWGLVVGTGIVTVGFTLAGWLGWPLGPGFWRAYAGVGATLMAIEAYRSRRGLGEVLRRVYQPDGPQVVLALGIVGAVAAKLVAVATMVAPPCHDPAAHALMAKIVAQAGRVPWTELPFRRDPFFYPPGLASVVAASAYLSGLAYPYLVSIWTNASVLFAGLGAYGLIKRATASRGAGIFAFGFLVFLAMMPSAELYMAGKNASVLSAFLFVACLSAAFRFHHRPSTGWAVILAMAMAGTFLVHYEKIVFLAVFFVAYGLLLVTGALGAWRYKVLPWLGVALLAVLLVSPWLRHLGWAQQWARLSGTPLMPVDPSPYLGQKWSAASLGAAWQSFWGIIKRFTDPVLAWLFALSPVALLWRCRVEALVLILFAFLISVMHPAVIEPLGISMASLSYDRITVHFAYVPVSLAAGLTCGLLWAGLRRVVPERGHRWLRGAAVGLAALLLVWGGSSQFGVYRRVAKGEPMLDAHDLKAFSWINANLHDDRSFLFPVGGPDLEHRRFFLSGAGLYMAVFTSHDAVCNFLRIETDAIADEYRRYRALLDRQEPDRWAASHWFYVRSDQPYYDEVARWLEGMPPGQVRVQYHEGPVRILSLVGPDPVRMASRATVRPF